MSALKRIKALQKELAKEGKDLNKPQAGGEYAPPATGPVRLRFVEYIEVGVHTTKFKGAPKTKPRAFFGFELSGPKHPPKVLEDGRVIPQMIRFKEVKGDHPKNGYIKLFKIMAVDRPDAKNFVDLLGEAYRGLVSHYEFQRADGGKGVIAQLKDDAGYHIASTIYEDPESGESKQVKVDEPVSELKVFLWDYADTEQWDDLFVDGTYDDGSSKNKMQELIKAAENFEGSAIWDALTEAGREDELVPAPKGNREGKPAQEEEQEEGDEAAPTKATKPAARKAPAKAAEPPPAAAKSKGKATPPAAAKTAQKPVKSVKPSDEDEDPLAGL